MNWLNDVLYFLTFPALVLLFALVSYRGSAVKYKIVRETNSLGEVRYEVWFDYPTFVSKYSWRLEAEFDTEKLANDFIARRSKTRETVKEGTL